MAIFLGNEQPEWPQQVRPSTDNMFPYYGMSQGAPETFLPGFSDDAATGMCIKIKWTSNYGAPSQYDYVDKAGTASSAGVWPLAIGDVTDANVFVGQYMDDTDECLYILVMNTDLAPDRYKLVSIDKEGVLTQSFAWTTPSGTSFDMGAYVYTHVGSLFRAGGDGSGNFEFINLRADIGRDGTAFPHRGTIMTFASSDGALTEAALVPDTAARAADPEMYGTSVTTSNNIVAFIAGNVQYQRRPYGTLLNKSTGNTTAGSGVLFPTNLSGSLKIQNATYYPCGGFWRGYYWLGDRGYAGTTPLGFWNITDIHNMVDEMAVQYGIL